MDVDRWIKRFQKLKNREKILLIVLAVSVGFSIYFQAIYKPLARRIVRYKFQIEKSKSRLKELELKFPQLETQRQNIHSLTVESKDLLERITEIEKTLPSKGNVSRLLDELVRQTKGLKLTSVRQKLETGEEYSRSFVELKFHASYKDTVNYIRRIESISPFLVIEELDISEPKGKEREEGILTRLVLSTLLGETPTAEQIKIEEKEPIETTRDIFVSKLKPVSKLRKEELKLEGITYNPQGPTAIVNDEVVKIGSKVDSLIVKEIYPHEVILTDGIEEHSLTIER